MTYERKYVHLRGRADVRVATDGRIAVYLYDGLTGKVIINHNEPFVFSTVLDAQLPPIPTKPIAFPPNSKPLRFLDIDMIASFGKKAFNLHLPTLKKIYPEITWELADNPNSHTVLDMNSTDPPEEDGN